MRNIINKEIKELLVDKKIWFGILTVLIIIIIGTYYNGENRVQNYPDRLKLGVINEDDSAYSDLLLSYFNNSETFSSLITVIDGESEAIKAAFQQGELDIYLEIPVDFAQNMINIKHTPIIVTMNIEDTTKALLFQNVLKSYEKYIAAVEINAVGLYEIMKLDGMDSTIISDSNKIISMDMIFTALGKEAFFSFQPIDIFPSTTIVEYYLMSIVIMVILYGGLYVGFCTLREVQLGTFSRVKTTRLPLTYVILAKVLIMTLFLSSALLASILMLSNAQINLRMILFCVTSALLSVSMATFLCSLFKLLQQFILVGNLLLFYFILIGGGIIPIRFLPEDIVRMSKFTPNYYMMKGMLLIKQSQRYAETDFIIAGFLLVAIIMLVLVFIIFNRRSVAVGEA